jgi:hypothetical protein
MKNESEREWHAATRLIPVIRTIQNCARNPPFVDQARRTHE